MILPMNRPADERGKKQHVIEETEERRILDTPFMSLYDEMHRPESSVRDPDEKHEITSSKARRGPI